MSQSQQSIRSFFSPQVTTAQAVSPVAASHSAASGPPKPPKAGNITSSSSPLKAPTRTSPPSIYVPLLPPPPSFPSQASIVRITELHIQALRRINTLLLQIPYPDDFYGKALDPLASGLLSRAILWRDNEFTQPKVIGGLVCRIEGQPARPEPAPRSTSQPSRSTSRISLPESGTHAIYIQSLALLSPYRGLGLAAALLEHVITSAALIRSSRSPINPRLVYAHVWTENADGLRWYEAREFSRSDKDMVKGYYFKLRPDTAWVVTRHIGSCLSPQQHTSPGRFAAAAAAATITNSTPVTSISLPFPLTTRPAPPPPSLSYQNNRPDTEWNDLPEDMMKTINSSSSNGHLNLVAPTPNGKSPGDSSRNSVAAQRRKKERAYPAAAFGNN